MTIIKDSSSTRQELQTTVADPCYLCNVSLLKKSVLNKAVKDQVCIVSGVEAIVT